MASDDRRLVVSRSHEPIPALPTCCVRSLCRAIRLHYERERQQPGGEVTSPTTDARNSAFRYSHVVDATTQRSADSV